MRLPGARKAKAAPLTEDTPVVTSTGVHDRKEPVRLVVRWYDDEPLWSFLSNTESGDDEPLLLHAAHLLASDVRLVEVVDLVQGMFAIRHRLDDPWVRRRFRTNDDFDQLMESGDLAPTWPYPPHERNEDRR